MCDVASLANGPARAVLALHLASESERVRLGVHQFAAHPSDMLAPQSDGWLLARRGAPESSMRAVCSGDEQNSTQCGAMQSLAQGLD